ncbi:MAG: MYG1 family protein [Selenomonadaceae bacterium]
MTFNWNTAKAEIEKRINEKASTDEHGQKYVRVVVHDGIFHADDVMCVALIRVMTTLPVSVIRTRNLGAYKDEGFILDVGAEDSEGARFLHLDHHQEGSGERENGVKMSACGKLADWLFRDTPEVLTELHRQFLAQIEAMDNGQDMPELGAHVLAFVYTFNGTWIETSGSEEESRAFADKAFSAASDIATMIARRMLRRIVDDMAAEQLVDDCIAKSKGRVITLDKYMPWKPSVIRENKRRKENGEMPFLLMLFPGLDGNYHIQTVPVDFHTFEDEMKLPEAWAGLEGDALAKATGLSDAVFCHKGRFMAIFKSKESAVKAAHMALEDVGAVE